MTPGRRVSVTGLLACVAAVAVAIAATRHAVGHPAEWFTLTVVSCLAAGVAAACGRGRVRAFGVGFALLGGGYLILGFSPLGDHLPTETLFDGIDAALHEPPALPPDPFDARAVRGRHALRAARFRGSLHSLTALVLGLAGGAAARLLAHPDGEREPDDPPEGTLLGAGDPRAALKGLWGG